MLEDLIVCLAHPAALPGTAESVLVLNLDLRLMTTCVLNVTN